MMATHNVVDARLKPRFLVNEAANSHRPAAVAGKRPNAVVLAGKDYETLYFLSVPGMPVEAKATP